jgi:tetratricopeptide (TPR) repeat protein
MIKTRNIFKAGAFLPLVAITLASIALMFLINDVTIYLRTKELASALQSGIKRESNIDYIGMISRYSMQKKLYQKNITISDADKIEFNSNLVSVSALENKPAKMGIYDYLAVPSRAVVNILRVVSGKNPLQSEKSSKISFPYLVIGYYCERNSQYLQAIEAYKIILEKKPDDIDGMLYANVHLHIGYCYAILGDTEKAKSEYSYVVNNYNGSKVAVVAAILLEYIRFFSNELDFVTKEKDSVEKGEKLYNLIHYKKAFEVFTTVKSTDAEKTRISYFKAKCLEGLNRNTEAVEAYQSLIKDNPKSPYSRSANVRIYKLGYFMSNGHAIRNLAKKNNEIIDDESFTKYTESEKIFVDKDKIQDYQKDAENLSLKIGADDELIAIAKKETTATDEVLIIYTNDGEKLKGVIGWETEKYIYLETDLGEFKIEKKNIVSRKVSQ